jgi:phage portal protein BeeE
VGAVISFRASVFSEATFKWQGFQNGRPGDFFGTPDLSILERPWPGAGTSHLLAAMESDISVYGNSYWIRDAQRLLRLDPCHVTIITAAVKAEDGTAVTEELIGYAFKRERTKEPVIFLPSEVAHYRLTPDPENPFRGTSWLRSVLSDADADSKMTGYKQALLVNSAVPGMVLKAEPGISPEQVTAARDALKARNTGWDKVGRTLILGAGFDPVVVGANMQQLDMKSLQGAGESRIAAAAGVSPVLVGFSEGLQGSSLNAGNYGAARRRFADGTVRPLWRAACSALATLVPPPTGSRLWIDDRDVSFLQEDVKDAADIKATEANTIESLIRAGFTPETARDAIITGDFSRLQHTGLYSVQLQPPGADQPPARGLVVASEPREAQTFHIHLPESTEVELRQDRVVDMLEQFGNAINAIEARTAMADERMAAMPAPIVNVAAPNVTVNVPENPVQLTLDMPTPVINVPAPLVTIVPNDDGPHRKSVKFTKDADGQIVGATVIEG